MNLKNRPGTYLTNTGLGLIAIGLLLQLAVSFSGGNSFIILTFAPLGLLLAAIGFCRRVLFALEHMGPVPGYRPAPAMDRAPSDAS